MARDFTGSVLDVVGAIPPGRVMTYGDVAAVLGSRAARTVGQVMARASEGVPWWRVVRASGHVASGHEAEAIAILEREGCALVQGAVGWRVDLMLARHTPD